MKRLTSATQGLAIIILEDFGGAMKSAVDGLAKFFNRLSESSDAIQSVLKFIVNLTKFIGLYKAAQIAATVATKAQTAAIVAYQLATGTATIATKRMIVSVRTLNTTILKNPYLAAGALLVALATDMFNLRIETDETKNAWKELNNQIYGDVKRTKERQEAIELLKNEVITSRELGKAKESSLKLQREIDAEEKSREQVERDAIKRAEEMHWMTQDLKDAYVARTLAGHDQDIQLKKQQKSELDLAISQAKVLDTTREQIDAIKGVAKAQEELDSKFISNVSDEYWNNLVEDVLSGKLTVEQAEQDLADFQIELIDSLLLDESLSTAERAELDNQLTELKLQNYKKTTQASKDSAQEQKDIELANLEILQTAAGAIFDIMGQNADRKLEQERKSLEERKEAGVISQEEYEQEVEKVQRKAFKQKKKRDSMEVIMNTAMAVAKVFAQTGVFGFAAVAPIIAVGAAQLALIQNQKYALGGMIEEFANGGMIQEFANGGMVHGKSHANGGEKFAVGGRVVELEGGEAVINKRSTAMFRNQLSAMNSAGGGVKFADGGLLNMPSFSQQQFNALGQNQMMGAMGGASKVVVVEADITSTQNSVSVIESDAII